MRRLRSRKKRAQLFLDYGGKCANCKSNLINWHADHKIPYVLIRKTDYVNMQPLCPVCNLKKGMKVLSPKNNDFYERLNLGLHVDIAPFRIGQKGAFNCIVEKVMDHSPTISIVLPTRYGKSDVIRASAIELIERGVAEGVLIAAPCKFLRDQLTQKKKIDEMVVRYTIATSRPITYDVLDGFRFPIFQNQEHFVSLTTQMLATNADQICEYIKQYIKKTGKLFLVYIDESHSQSDVNTWGAVVPKIIAAGGIVILCTATPYRDDGKKIPGFKCFIENQREKMRHVPRQHDDPDKYWVDIYKDIEGDLRLEADYEYTFKKAWAEGNVICKVSRGEFDVVVKIPNKSDDDMKEIKISEMSRPECRKYFGRVVRDPKVIQGGVEKLLNRLIDYRLSEPSAQAIIFCGNDVDDEDDGHAKQIATEISCQSTKFKVVIATSKQDDADVLIKQFGEGKGDILIVKQMASLGMDIPPIKLGLDLSAVRTLAAFIQRMMRTATMWGKNEVAHLIIPSDVNGLALWNGFIEENGGNMTAHDATLIESLEKDKEDKDESPSKKLEVVRTEDTMYSDTSGMGTSGSLDYTDYAQPLIKYQPKLQAVLTDHETIMLGKQLGRDALDKLAPNKIMEPTRDITEQRRLLKNKIKVLTKEVANSKYSYGTHENEWIAERKDCVNRAKRAVGIHPRTQMDSITNVDQLTKIKTFLENELNSSKSKVSSA